MPGFSRDVAIRIVGAKLDQLRSEFPAIVQDATTEMVIGISQGTGRQGQSLIAEKPYDPAYARRKESKGRDVSKVDMTYSGLMLDAITVTRVEQGASSITCVVGATDPLSKNKIRGNLRYRDFFGFTQQMIATMKFKVAGILQR